MRPLIAIFTLLILAPPLPAQQSVTEQAQREVNIARRMINDQRNTALAFHMQFTQQEKEKFWPLYREYRTAMGVVGDKRLAVIVDYAEHMDAMTEGKAKQLLDQSFSIQKEGIKVQQKYVGKFRRFLPETKVVRLMQIENRMDTMVDMKIAESIPLME